VYKICADGGANFKKAFSETKSMANDLDDILNHLLEKVSIEEENETITIDDR